MKRLLIVISILFFTSHISRPQQFFFTNYPIEKGLSQSVVNCVFQDSRGYIWAGTQNGLNRFDGYNFRIYSYNPSDTSSLSNSWIYSIDEDKEGNLWIGTKDGLNQFVRKENLFRRIKYSTKYENNLANYPYDVRVARDGSILINTPPVLVIYSPKRNSFKYYTSIVPYDGSVKDNRIPLLEDHSGRIWIGSTRGLACFNRSTETFSYYFSRSDDPKTISNNNITAIYEDCRGNLWIGTSSGLNILDRKSNSIRRIFNEPGNLLSLSNNFIRAITGDTSGAVWIGTEGGGLNRAQWSADKEQVVTEHFSSERNGLGHNIILGLCIDQSRNLWIGTLQGLSKTDLKPRKFHLYRRDDTPFSTNLTGNVIASLYKDDQGLVWIGTWGQGLNLLDRRTGQVSQFSTQHTGKQHLQNDFVHVIFADNRKNIWIGTRDGIYVYDKLEGCFERLRRFFKNPGLPDFIGVRINTIVGGRDDSYWVGTQDGLYRITLNPVSTGIFRQESFGNNRISGNLVYSLLEDRDGLIWIATLNGLDVYDPGKGTMKHFQKNEKPNALGDNFVISLCEDHHGDIWIGTSSYVNRFVKHDSAFVYYAQEQGLPNNRIFEIVEDNSRNLWFATGCGLCRLDTVSGRFRTYSVEEGLQSMEFNLRACYNSSDGEVFFGGMNGFNSFYPDSLYDNPFIPQIVFTSFYKTRQAEKEYIDVENASEVVMDYNDHTFTIEFAALEFTNPEKNRYAYKLEGVSDDWIETGNRRFVPFSNLPPGTYTFRVKGSNNDGIWNVSGPSLRIIINPPWWRSNWALTAYLILFAGMIMVFVRIRERALVRERDTLEQKVHSRTLQIEEQNAQILQKNEELNKLNSALSALNATRDKFFSIIAHDLRNPFNTILGLAEMSLTDPKVEEPEKMRKTISGIRDTAKHTFDLLQNLLIWARSQTGALDFEPVLFDISERIIENIDLVKSQAENKNIKMNYPDPAPLLVTGDIHMIDTVLRNLLTNAIKFTPQEGRVTVTARRLDGHVEVTIVDTGIGISPENLSRLFLLDNKYIRKGTEKERGSGLGLILCHEFIEKHKGTIRVESLPGKGSSFIITLPE